MKDNMIYKDVFKCSNCGLEMDENYIGCPECKEFGTIKFLRNVAVGPCDCAVCIQERKQKEKHYSHPFYAKALQIWTNAQEMQIQKGADKYPEPFTPSSWSNEQLAEHAIQENVDQLHYIVGMKERMEQQEKEIEELKNKNDYMLMELKNGSEKIIKLEKENENQLHYINSARKDYTQALETINELRKEIRQVNEDSMKIESVSDFNADECQRLREENAALEEKYKAKFEEYETLFEISGRQNKNTVLDKREIERLAKKTVELENKISDLESENRTLKGEF